MSEVEKLQLQVMNSPFDQEQVDLLNQILPKLTEAQQLWLGGYISALHIKDSTHPSGEVAVLEKPDVQTNVVSKEVTILYGSQTGNGQHLAEQLSKNLETENFNVTLSAMNEFKTNRLKKIEYLLLIVSTHGEGDPPDNAVPFYELLHGRRAPQLEHLQFSVLSLGDSSYEFFCQTGKDFEKRLLELGATPLAPRIDCDLDFDEPASQWFKVVISKLNELNEITPTDSSTSSQKVEINQTGYSRTNPFYAEVLENLNLNGRGSKKEIRHLELSLEGSNLQYEPGDSIGIYPKNDPELVDALIAEMSWDREESVTVNAQGDLRALREALISNFEITVLTKPLLQKASTLTSNPKLHELLEGDEKILKNYLYGRDLLDFVQDFAPWEGTANDFVAILRKIPVRLYSIASSYEANPDEVHVTIGTVRYTAHERERFGVCSGECARRIKPGDTLPIYVQRNANFKLPDHPDTPIIMVGPGTGISPFRSFLEQREEIGARGKSWLFFGDQHYTTDFLYQVEWQRWLKDGVLTRMDVAFSRDTDEKVYVQHKMLENSRDLFQWLEEGAVVYVCGDKKHMAKDVHQTLVDIIETEGKMTFDEAKDYLAQMQQRKRYQRDIY